jgi:hypothetical protein
MFSFKQLCKLCKFKTNENLKKINGNFKVIETPNVIKDYKLKKKFTSKSIKNFYYKDIDNGLATYASYLTNSRDKDLEGYFANSILSNNLNTTNTITDFLEIFLKKNKFSNIYSFNSRMNLYRPILRICEKYKLKFNNLEASFDDPKLRIQNLGDSIVTDFDKMPILIKNYWKKKSKIKREKIINKYYSETRHWRKALENPTSYLAKQKKDLLPDTWDVNKYNMVFFVSSEDEYETIEKRNFKPIFKNQLECVKEICKIIRNKKNFNLWIRMHPNLGKVKWDYSKNFNTHNFFSENVNIIEPDSEVSTYALLDKSNLVIGLRSRTLIEANFIKKPTLVIGKNYWASLGPFIQVKTKLHLIRLILSNEVKVLDNIASKRYAFFWGSYGYFSKYISGKFQWREDKRSVKINFKFKGTNVAFSTFQKITYLFFKILDKTIFSLNFKLSKYFSR